MKNTFIVSFIAVQGVIFATLLLFFLMRGIPEAKPSSRRRLLRFMNRFWPRSPKGSRISPLPIHPKTGQIATFRTPRSPLSQPSDIALSNDSPAPVQTITPSEIVTKEPELTHSSK